MPAFFESFSEFGFYISMLLNTRKTGMALAIAAVLLMSGCASSESGIREADASGSQCPAHLVLACADYPGGKTHCFCSSREDVRAFTELGREWHRY